MIVQSGLWDQRGLCHAQSHTASSGQLGFVLVVKRLRQGAQVEGPSHSSSVQGADPEW